MTEKKSPSILVIDDEAPIRKMLSKRLITWHYDVFTAADGREGLDILQDETPDVVITDLFMPEMDGFDVLARLAQISPETPTIVLSGQGRLGDAIRAMRLGAWDYLYKPIDELYILKLTIEKVLDKARLVAENKAYQERLEELVAEKSAKLMEKNASLEKANEALKALLDHRETEKKSIEQAMLVNLKRFVFPYLDTLQQARLSSEAQAYLAIIRTNIEELISPIAKNLNAIYLDLTPTEIKIADLIRQGLPTKTIADILKTSTSTVSIHRNNIRKKLGLLNRKVNLHTYLNSLP